MSYWWLLALALLPFGWTAWRGAPWLPTRRKQAEASLELLDLAPGQTVLDLGSGGGKFLSRAAQNDLKGIGFELNPWLYLWSRLRLFPYRHQVKVYCRDYWLRPLPECDGVYVFLIGHYMDKLDDKLSRELPAGAKVVSYTFELPRQPLKTTKDGLYLYEF